MELIQKIKHAYAIYHQVDGITKTLKHQPKLKVIIEELNHYPQSILIIAIIEAMKKTVADKRGNYSEQLLFKQTLKLISDVNYITENIDVNKINNAINREVH